MKMILKIARTELRNLFYSPVAWFLTIVFLVQCGMYYTEMVYNMARYQEYALENTPAWKDFGISMTKSVFGGYNGLFTNVLQNLYLFIPLLTMGMISKETNNGTIRLLYSSPVTIRQIVLGKYVAIIFYNCLLVAIAGVFMVNGVLSIKSADYGLMLSASLGFFLLVCAYTAIGMFMSSLTGYQIVSAVATFLSFYVLSQIGGLWQQYDLIRDLTYFLSILGRTTKMMKGLITTNDVIYFVLIVYMFIAFTLFRLKGTRESSPWYKKATRYLMVFTSVLVIGYATSRPGFIGYWDATAQKVNTIHENSQKIIQQLGDDPVEVTLYSNILGAGFGSGHPAARNRYIWDMWEQYLRFKPNIELKYVDYYDHPDGDSSIFKRFPGKNLQQIAKLQADMYNVSLSRYKTPAEIRKMIDLKPENYRLVMQVKYKGRTAFLRTFDDMKFWPDEANVGAVLKRLEEGTNPKVYFVTGDLERSIYKMGEREYAAHTTTKSARYGLINHGIDCDTVSLDARNIPADIDLLVLADPKVQLSDIATKKIKQYIQKGGNMMILGEPGKQQVVNPVLQEMGVRLMDGTLIEISKDEMPHMVYPCVTIAATELAKEDDNLRQLKELLKNGTGNLRILNAGAAGIEYIDSGYDVKHLLVTSNRNAWAKVGKLVTDSADPVFEGPVNERKMFSFALGGSGSSNAVKKEQASFVVPEGDYKRDSFSTAISLSRHNGKKEQRIIVFGDGDIFSNLRFDGTIGIATYSWLVNNRYPIYTPRDKPKDVLMTVSLARAKVEKVVFVWGVPGLVLLFGTILLIRRKRQ